MKGGERQLWCAVIDRAMHDALGDAALSGYGDRARIQEEARRWFLRNGRDFRLVCDAAGYDPDALRAHVLRLMATQEQAAATAAE